MHSAVMITLVLRDGLRPAWGTLLFVAGLTAAAQAQQAPATSAGSASVDQAAPAATGVATSPGLADTSIVSSLPGVNGLLPATGIMAGAGFGNNGLAGPQSVLGDRIRQTLFGAQPVPGAVTRRWTIVPSVGITQEWTDNANVAANGRPQADFITSLLPSLGVIGDTPRAQVNFDYDPSLIYYADDHSQSRIAQNLNARALVSVVDGLFLDLRGFAAEQTRTGALGPTGTDALSRNDAAQDYSFSASPYWVHRFGTTGTGEVGYTIARTIQTGETGTTATLSPFLVNGEPVPTTTAQNQTLTTQNVHAAFVTGEDFSRYNGAALASFSSYDGTGVLAGGHRYVTSLDNGYAITRTITALAELGWEDLRYSGTNPLRVGDATWSVGGRFAPSPDTALTLRYGHHDGFNALEFDGSWAPTARTRLFASYSEGLETQQEGLQNALASSDLDALGTPVDHTTGAPLFLSSDFFGEQSSLYRVRRLSFTGLLAFTRDTFSLTIEDEARKLVSSSGVVTGGLTGSNTGIFGTVSWSHELSERLSSALFFQGGELRGSTTAGSGTTTTTQFTVSAQLRYLLGENLYAQLQYSFNTVDNPITLTTVSTTQSASTQNLVLLSLVKTF
jgi:hypothetical protein